MAGDFLRMLDITADDVARRRELVVCRCNGHHLEFEVGWCSKCGHWLPHEVAEGFALYDAFVARLEAEYEAGPA